MGDHQSLNVGVFIYNEVEELDFVGPYETFQAAGKGARDRGLTTDVGFRMFTVAESIEPITTSGGLRILPHHGFADHPTIDLLVVPGGDSRPQVASPTVIDWVTKVAAGAKLTTSVCTGAHILGRAGLLDGHRATTHWASVDRLAQTYPNVEVQRDVRWVDDGPVVSAAGVSAGIDMALHVVSRIFDRDLAESTARYMEYNWNQNPTR